jgi:Predicted nucleoside-diphosphate sugar epimerases
MSIFKDKVLLITGGTGSFGNAVLGIFLDIYKNRLVIKLIKIISLN